MDDDDEEFSTIDITRMYCRNEDRGEMICVGIILPMFDGDPIQFLHQCTVCGALEIFRLPYPMIYPIDVEGYDEDDDQ